MGALNNKIKKENKTKSRSVGQPAHTHSHCSRKAKHTHREREKGRPLNAIKTKQKQLRCSAHAARQDGSGACRAKESTNGPAWVCMHIYNGHIIVCASWGEVRARVHARGHTHREREKEECVCGRCMALSHSLSRGHHRSSSRTRNNKKKQKRGGGVGDRGAAVTVDCTCCVICYSCGFDWCFLPGAMFIFTSFCTFCYCTVSCRVILR
ncbi:hypothetical protein TCDM_12868 [Trypanosoma cruzi Dm28c]|uniref:Uncharacterized protein n=1 Tax=Trypanosoma cruzi Dm28c TaxID=1416333 RepID=V5CJV8_TRYCR|nr:hypothetical protein TCDM_12868 [Trypanosoma cruzi Dm28c]